MDSLKHHIGIKYPIIPSLILYLVFFMGFACHSTSHKEGESSSEELKESEIWNPFIILTQGENKLVEAKSDKLYKKRNDAALLVGNVKIDFYNDEGNHISILYSDSARINEYSNDLNANGNVYVVSDSGYTLTTSKIVWDNSYKMILAEDSVMFTTSDGNTLQGVGFESDADLEEWRIFRPFGVSREGI